MLREFLYVDVDKVRSVLAQMDGGVTEEVRTTEKKQGNISGGIKNIASREHLWGTEESAQRSLADAIFPTLEEALEADGYLVDASEELQVTSEEAFDAFREQFPPGSFVRITAPARLFDARYVAKTFGSIGATVSGVTTLASQQVLAAVPSQPGRQQRGNPTPKQSTPKQNTGSRVVREAGTAPELEDLIPDFDSAITGGVGPEKLRAVVKVARGMFQPGLHVAMSPQTAGGLTVTARLQEGRRYLDSDPEVLFARYGVQDQEWTMVGTVGAYSVGPNFELANAGFADAGFVDGMGLSRSKLVSSINNLIEKMGTIGVVDLPQYPGLSVVPFAVYRPILREGKALASQ